MRKRKGTDGHKVPQQCPLSLVWRGQAADNPTSCNGDFSLWWQHASLLHSRMSLKGSAALPLSSPRSALPPCALLSFLWFSAKCLSGLSPSCRLRNKAEFPRPPLRAALSCAGSSCPASSSSRAEPSCLAGSHHTAFPQHPRSQASPGESSHMAEPAGRSHAGNPLQKPAATHSRQRCPAFLQCHHTLQEGSWEECFGEGN